MDVVNRRGVTAHPRYYAPMALHNQPGAAAIDLGPGAFRSVGARG